MVEARKQDTIVDGKQIGPPFVFIDLEWIAAHYDFKHTTQIRARHDRREGR